MVHFTVAAIVGEMKIKLTTGLIVEGGGQCLVFVAGDVVDLPTDQAIGLIRSGYAVPDGLQYEQEIVGPAEHRSTKPLSQLRQLRAVKPPLPAEKQGLAGLSGLAGQGGQEA